jgi:hypothetical protein
MLLSAARRHCTARDARASLISANIRSLAEVEAMMFIRLSAVFPGGFGEAIAI